MKKQIRLLIEKMTGLHILQQLPLGVDEFADVKSRFPSHRFRVILDVGANVGQTAAHIRSHFPHAEIHSLEPITATYNKLVANTRHLNIKTHPYAIGATNEEIQVNLQVAEKDSVINSLTAANNAANTAATQTETVKVLTLERFCEMNNIKHIDFLKIDTEGFDLEVIKGAENLVRQQEIPFVIAEVSMNPTNTFHVSFEAVKQHMEARGYYLFALYDQTQEWKTKTPILRRVNALFVSGKMAGVNR